MSNTASSSIKINEPEDVLRILQELFKAGWSMTFQEKITYLPLGDTDYDWKSRPQSDKILVLEELRKKAQAKENIGLEISYGDVGGEFLFTRNDFLLTFSWSINTKRKDGLCDFGWYIDRIKPALSHLGFGPIASVESDSGGTLLVQRVD